MGLDAFVRCRCWQDGIFNEPPFSRDLIAVDAEGYLGLTVPYEGNEELDRAFYQWIEGDACPHADMELVSVRVSNWGGYRIFQEALRSAGCEHFPVLCAELPDGNGGSLPPDLARTALAELDFFRHRAELGEETRLVDEESGKTLATYVAGYEGVFTWDGSTRHQAGVDPRGFFVRGLEEPHEEEFRSLRFTQEQVGERRVRFSDGERTVTLTLSGPVRADSEGRYPRRLQVVSAPVTAADFAYILEPLEAVFRASIETGNPVQWC
ncbi:hypothetical protein SMC26_11100 [Actinomadura fulvescens]|uniref:Uncharacterized protein n=1 Tax=Actinomadura fulvescens TaxID=46160 RepID=A0ABP6C919_9ACTN